MTYKQTPRLIAHRGNINGPNMIDENRPNYIENALNQGYDVEVDLWYIDNKFYLGHDFGVYEIKDGLLYFSKRIKYEDSFWIHAKNLAALEMLTYSGYNYFYHDKEKYVLTSKGMIWTYPGENYCSESIIVSHDKNLDINNVKCFGICSDYVGIFKERLEKNK